MERPELREYYQDLVEVDSDKFEYFHSLTRVTIEFANGSEAEYWLDSYGQDWLMKQMDDKDNAMVSMSGHELYEGELTNLTPLTKFHFRRDTIAAIRYNDTTANSAYYGLYLDLQYGLWKLGASKI